MKAHLMCMIAFMCLYTTKIDFAQGHRSSFRGKIAFVASKDCNGNFQCPQDIHVIDLQSGAIQEFVIDNVIPGSIEADQSGSYISYLTSDGTFHILNLAEEEAAFSLDVGYYNIDVFYKWSPNADRIAINYKLAQTDNQNLYLLDWQKNELTQITNNLEVGSQMDWSTSGSILAFFASEQTHLGPQGIFVFDVETGIYVEIPEERGFHYSPTWSQRGNRLAYTFGQEKPNQIAVMDESFQKPTEITIGSNWIGDLNWVLDDQNILFFENDPDIGGSILRMDNVENAIITTLVNESISGFDVSPSREALVYLTTIPSNDLCLLDLRTLHKECLNDVTPFYFDTPVWIKG